MVYKLSVFKRSLFSTLIGALGVASIMSSTSALAQEGVIMRDILSSIGVISNDKDPIVYRERAPLVVPPKMQLTQPMPADEMANNPAWPKDPDLLARKKAETLSRVPVTETERYKLEKNPRLSIEEIRSGRRAGAQITDAPAPRAGDNDNYELYYKPMAQGRAMAAQQSKKAEELLTYGQEPERRYLTDPPKGLRMPASTAAIPKRVEREVEVARDDIDQQGFAARGY